MAYDIGPFDGGGENLGARRLLALADHLATVRDEDYDHRFWRQTRSSGQCVMCALGHGVTALSDVLGLQWRDGNIVQSGSTMSGANNACAHAAAAFDISLDAASMMFGAGPATLSFYGVYDTTEIKLARVADAIRRFAEAKLAGKEPNAPPACSFEFCGGAGLYSLAF